MCVCACVCVYLLMLVEVLGWWDLVALSLKNSPRTLWQMHA